MTSLTTLSRTLAAGAALILAGASLQAQHIQTLTTHQPFAIGESTRLERLASETPIKLSIGLPLRNPSELEALRVQLHTPGNPLYHRWITPQEFTERFGPTQADYDRVVAYMQGKGLKVTHTYSNRLILNVSGASSDVERALNVQMHNYRHASGRTFRSHDVAPSLDLDVQIATVNGLNDFVKPMSRLHRENVRAITPHTGSGSGGAYIGRDFRAAYAPGVSGTGSGQGIALFEFSNYYDQDPTNYWADAGMSAPAVTRVDVGGGTTSYNGEDEVSLDIEVAGALAPGAHIYVYMGEDGNSILNQIATDNTCKQVGVSWGWWTNSMTRQTDVDSSQDAILQQMDAQGIAVFVAAGDSGTWTSSQWGQTTTNTSQINPVNPADCPTVTCVGGTVLSTSSAGGAWSNETVWSSGGGGYSHRYAMPSFQNGVNWSSISGASTTQRNTPDVAMVASNVVLDYNNGSRGSTGGTSIAAPLWAAFSALTNQYALSNGKPAMGFINPLLYGIGTGSSFSTSMHDIKSGNDGLPAATGYDMATGWGSPAGQGTINALLGINNLLTASITAPASNQTVASGTAVSFTGAASGGTSPYAYSWTFGDGGSASGASASHTFTNTGSAAVNYTVTFTATDSASHSASATRTITVNPAAGISVSLNPATVTMGTGATQQFTASVSGTTNTAVTWSVVEAGGGSVASNGLYTAPTTAGTYHVKATSQADASKSATATVTVTGIINDAVTNGGFESGSTGWSGNTGDINTWSGEPAHAGSKNAWICGNGSTATESLSQSITIPSTAASATLTFWMHIDTAETTTSTAYDTFKIQVISGTTTTTLATYSNLDKNTGYVQKAFDLSAYKGKTLTLKFLGSEDYSDQTSFVLDDVSVKVQ